MSGVIENHDPGASSIHMHAYAISSAAEDVASLNVELLVDRLRFMGLDRDLINEAEQCLRADANAGMRWVEEQLSALDPPPRPPSCDCGEPLVS